MMLNQTTEYAFRAMVCLAGLEAGACLRAEQISDATNIPVHYLAKVMRRLVRAKLVSSQRGHHGGFALARPASAIPFVDVLRAVGVDEAPHCAFGWSRCNAAVPCPMHDAWSAIRGQFHAWAEAHTLASIRPRLEGDGGAPARPRRRLPVRAEATKRPARAR